MRLTARAAAAGVLPAIIGALAAAGCGGTPDSATTTATRTAASGACPSTPQAWGGAALIITNTLQRRLTISTVDPVGFYGPPPAFTQSAGTTRERSFPVNTCGTVTLVIDAGGNTPARIPLAVGSYVQLDFNGTVQTQTPEVGWTLVPGSSPALVGTEQRRTTNCPSAAATQFTWSESSPLGGASNMKANATLTCDATATSERATLTVRGEAPRTGAP